jgi:hypothetical protein
MHFTKTVLACASGVLIASLLSACGGSSSDPAVVTQVADSVTLAGTAASGAPLAGANITVFDATGKSATATAGSDGRYTVVLTTFKAPLIVVASVTTGEAVKTFHALVETLPLAGGSRTANVTPLTDAIVALSSSNNLPGGFASNPALLAQLDLAKVAKAKANVAAALKDVFSELGLPADFDPVATSFAADRASGGDKLLETIKVSLSDVGVDLTNVRVTVSGSGATASVSLTAASSTPTALPRPTLTDDFKLLDSWVAQLNSCLALAPADRVTVSGNAPSALLGACNQITRFSGTYKRNGYTLLQRWGGLFASLPAGAKADVPEILGFFKSTDNNDQVLFRVPVRTSLGGTSYIETAEKIDGNWVVTGNQRNYDASIDVRLVKLDDLSSGNFVADSGPDSGQNVGKLSQYQTRLAFNFNQSGPNGADVYAVRVTGPGLPNAGLVLARSSACGTGDYLAVHSAVGSLPAATLSTAPTTSLTSSWRLAAKAIGTEFKGTDFWAAVRNNAGSGAVAYPVTQVAASSIPYLARYTWEVFTVTGGATAAATFTSRLSTAVVAPEVGTRYEFAQFSSETLDYLRPGNAKAAAQSSLNLSWASTPLLVNNAGAYGSGGGVRTQVGGSLPTFGATSRTVSVAGESNGLGVSCASNLVPAITATTGYRELSLRQSNEQSLLLQHTSYHDSSLRVLP